MLSIANTNSTATCKASSHSKDSERRLQAGVRFNLSIAKIVLFQKKKKTKAQKECFLQKLCSNCMVLRKIEMDLRIFFHKKSGIL